MKTIHKFPLNMAPGKHVLEIPRGSQYLKMLVQRGRPVIYFMVDTDTPEIVTFTYTAVFTGQELSKEAMPPALSHLDTLQVGPDVIHYFK